MSGLLLSVVSAVLLFSVRSRADASGTNFVTVAADSRTFEKGGKRFVPWGFNYDHDRSNRLLETYWFEEWGTVVEDFKEMKAMGANTVRIHLQVSHFMRSPTEPDRKSLKQLSRLLALAEETGLQINLTGLGCYQKEAVPEWFNGLAEEARWEVQARFWEAVAETARSSPALFCYDLINEPIVTEDKVTRDWTPGAFGNRYFVQRLTLDFKGRTAEAIAEAWVEKMTGAVRRHDPHHLVTIGAIPWAHTWPNAKPLFYSREVSKHLDFVSVHFYPKSKEVEKALKALRVYDIGKPIVIEEMFPLECSVAELDAFIEGSRDIATGWFGFYWGKTIPECASSVGDMTDAITGSWLEYFRSKAPAIGR
jgi:hypothetical protein